MWIKLPLNRLPDPDAYYVAQIFEERVVLMLLCAHNIEKLNNWLTHILLPLIH
jgi:hypothetical protein